MLQVSNLSEPATRKVNWKMFLWSDEDKTLIFNQTVFVVSTKQSTSPQRRHANMISGGGTVNISAAGPGRIVKE